ncbi:NfeD family protein [Bacillus sp. T33-2]|uniref:NfeD family protein n=1 Tax=Bacillus sp. T33-2 TaxID=2054168 RepID=UPI000C75A87D|nr:NfeD family protein [Bacillus sp. T33-2]PLR98169.1 hypothetical protein CVD19_06130 [Bacillus sp. T33-2]
MEVFGVPIETVYLYGLIGSGAFTVLYLLFGDLLEGVFESIQFLHPTLLFSFLTFFSAGGFLFEVYSPVHGILAGVLSASLALILVTLLNVFVLIPLRNTEESLVYHESDLKGRIGTVITPIPEDGFGEILIESISGRIARTAASFDQTEIAYGEKVLVIDSVKGVVQVKKYNEFQKYF